MPFGPPHCDFCNNSGGMEIMFKPGVWPCPYGCPPEDEDMREMIEETLRDEAAMTRTKQPPTAPPRTR